MLAQQSLPGEPLLQPREVFFKRDLKVTIGRWHQGFPVAGTLSLSPRLDKLAFDKTLPLCFSALVTFVPLKQRHP